MKPDITESRLRECGLWDETKKAPIFGWAPILFGWCIANSSVGGEPATVVLINGVSWKPPTRIPFSGASPYAENSGKYMRVLHNPEGDTTWTQ